MQLYIKYMLPHAWRLTPDLHRRPKPLWTAGHLTAEHFHRPVELGHRRLEGLVSRDKNMHLHTRLNIRHEKNTHAIKYLKYVDLYERGLRIFVSIFVLLLLLTTAQSICTGPILAKHGLPVARQVNRCPHGIVRNFFTLATNGSWDYRSLRGMWR